VPYGKRHDQSLTEEHDVSSPAKFGSFEVSRQNFLYSAPGSKAERIDHSSSLSGSQQEVELETNITFS
jgi:hypothetical protein